ncbi:MAG TPA: flagellar export protein FliJ [Pyrinomonadaceae bacterium]
MKRFKFSLQTVHDLRESRQEAAERDLATANSELYRANAQLEEVVRSKQTALERYLLMYQAGEIEVSMVAAHTDFIGSLFQREREAKTHIREVEQRLAQKRQAVTETMRETETTAKLRDHQRQNYLLDMNRNEQAMLDEMAVLAVARRRVSGQ